MLPASVTLSLKTKLPGSGLAFACENRENAKKKEISARYLIVPSNNVIFVLRNANIDHYETTSKMYG